MIQSFKLIKILHIAKIWSNLANRGHLIVYSKVNLNSIFYITLNINKLHLTIKANDINSNLSNVISFHHPDLTLHTSVSRKRGGNEDHGGKKRRAAFFTKTAPNRI